MGADVEQFLVDALDRDCFRGHRDEFRHIHIFIGQFHLPVRKRGRKKHGKPLFVRGQFAENIAHVLGKPKIEQPVGLIDNQDLDVRRVENPLLMVIDNPPRCTDHDIAPFFKRVGLFLIVDAADNLERFITGMATDGLGFFVDLGGEFTGRGHDQGQRVFAFFTGSGHQAGKQRHQKSGGLAGARLSLAGHVPPGQRDRDGPGLNRRAGNKSGVFQTFLEFGRQVK